MITEDEQSTTQWNWCGQRIPKNQIVYFTQIFFIFCVVTASIVQLALGNKHEELWVVLLCSCVGYVLPNPKLKFLKSGKSIRESELQ